MRINNPISLAGDLALATREYVYNSNLELETKVSNWLTGNNKHSIGSDGYAWLGKDGKVDPSLMPPLAITKVLTVPQWEVIEAAKAGSISSDAKPNFKVNAWLAQKDPTTHELLHRVQVGDMVLITYDKDDTDVPDSQKPYIVDAQLIGPYIVVSSTYQEDPNYDETVTPELPQVQKLIFPTNQILSVNGVTPDERGDVKVDLAGIYRYTANNLPDEYPDSPMLSNGTIGDELAAAICRIVPSGLLENNRFEMYEILPGTNVPVPVAYAKLNEVEFLSGTINSIKEDIGNRSDNVVTGSDEEKLEGSIFGQLKYFYNDSAIQKAANENHFTRIDNSILNTNDKIETIDSAINNNVTKIVNIPFLWKSNGTEIINGINITFETEELTYQNATQTELMNKFGYPSGSILWTATINNPGKVLACYEKNAKGNYDIVYPDIEFEILNPNIGNGNITGISKISIITLPGQDLINADWSIYMTENISYTLPTPSGMVIENGITHSDIIAANENKKPFN